MNPYTISLTKKIVNSLGDLLDTDSDDVFRFELTDKETNEKYEGYTENGNLQFALPGFDAEGEKTKTFSLKECLTGEQKEAGFVSSIPDGIDVHVSLNVEKEVASYEEKDNNVLLTSTTYTTKVSSVQIGNQSGDDAATVTNTLNLKTSVNIPVTKIADGIAAGSFAFGFKKIDNIDDVVNDPSNPTELKQANSLVSIATAEGATVKETGQLAESTKQKVEGTVSFDTEEYTAPGTYWYAIAEQNGVPKTLTAAWITMVPLIL